MKSYLLLALYQRAGVPLPNPVFPWPTTGNHPAPAPQADPVAVSTPEFQLV